MPSKDFWMGTIDQLTAETLSQPTKQYLLTGLQNNAIVLMNVAGH